MEAGEGEIIMATVAEMISEQYMNPLALMMDAMLIHLAAREAIEPAKLTQTLQKQRQRLSRNERSSPGEQLIQRAEMVCALLATGRVSEDDLHNVPQPKFSQPPHLRLVWNNPEDR